MKVNMSLLMVALMLAFTAKAQAAFLVEKTVEAAPPAANQAPADTVKSTNPRGEWEVVAGSSLRTTIETWAQRAGWRHVSWEIDNDFEVQAYSMFSGEFESAIAELIQAINHGGSTLRAGFYEGNLVIRITQSAR